MTLSPDRAVLSERGTTRRMARSSVYTSTHHPCNAKFATGGRARYFRWTVVCREEHVSEAARRIDARGCGTFEATIDAAGIPEVGVGQELLRDVFGLTDAETAAVHEDR